MAAKRPYGGEVSWVGWQMGKRGLLAKDTACFPGRPFHHHPTLWYSAHANLN